ncbi:MULTISPECIES: ATP-binding protein [Sphingomonas]|uniref:ATP-binding protein n=1 Tax=Sphingomonas TaxID=13687 RepID=UPI000F7F226A|nr:ATP-binding protein [Sphingomonas sp. ABOLF]RSV14250.1 hypothetical protein CA235_12425 [Sphingomonas sp. ABOLF]GLK21011.1 hypothetical protein GCM10017606_18370 [Microbacterium terregens]
MPVRVDRIVVSDFRAFPALAPADIRIGGCNLLVYGENGSGKSSIYRALRGLFSTEEQDILSSRNVFTDPPQPNVRVTLTDGRELSWSAAGHPGQDVHDIARRSAFLSHTRLAEMNTGATPDDRPNLFKVAVERLLADYEATIGGTGQTVGQLWTALNEALARREQYAGKSGLRRYRDHADVVERALARFNDGMNQAVGALEGHAKALLRRLLDVFGRDSLELIGLTYFGVTYDRKADKLGNETLTAQVRFRTHDPGAPQRFLNEGRQSALAISIYLAGRLASVPVNDDLRLLVLDDLLISLDHSHRRPVLDVVADSFKGWQIILLTHDRFWFEMAREQLLNEPWRSVEIYENTDGDGLLRPLVWESADNLVDETLKQASHFLQTNQPAAAANYARTACELTLRRYCKNHGIQFAYTDEPKKIKLDELLRRAEAHGAGDPTHVAAFTEVKRYKKLILNPLSHDPTQPVSKADVQAAILAVKGLVKICKRS